MRELTYAEQCFVGGAGSSKCRNCDCADKSQCVRKDNVNTCSWSGFGKATATGAIGGAIYGAIKGGIVGGPAGAAGGALANGLVSGIAGGIAYGATCWW